MKAILIITLAAAGFIWGQNKSLVSKPEVNFNGDAQIEVGSFYAGLEFHHSSPLPQRISFYYPVANSVDLSRDYWKRDSSVVMSAGIETNGNKEWVGFNYRFTATPYSVSFNKQDTAKAVMISYNFCKDKPAFIYTMEIKNISNKSAKYKVLTDLQLSLRTSHSYKVKDKAWSEYDIGTAALFINFDDRETGNARLFVANAGEKHKAFSSKSIIETLPVTSDQWWLNETWDLDNELISKGKEAIPSAKFVYEKELKPGESLKIIQIIGSVNDGEEKETALYLKDNFEQELKSFEEYVLNYAAADNIITGDDTLDRSIIWAKALLAVNKHYIDGSIQPMPCPAEYNFYFTHDVLLTDLATVKFDLLRVKKDLEFIISHADSSKIIPHAYYWKDTAYITEYATPDNWNHFWFSILCGSYFRHSKDSLFARRILPFVSKSIREAMINKKENVMFAYRPDWWDIGRNYGPRAFMTILAIKALTEFQNLSESVGEEKNELTEYQGTVSELQEGLNTVLWSNEKKYLMNFYEDGSPDNHYYIGSLLAAHFGLLDSNRVNSLIETAEKKLLDPALGIYTVYPMDFHQLTDYIRLVGNEAGDPHKYINGGIWPHGNAWYALALIKSGKREEAINFIKTTMTIDGIMNSPNGQPAMYEYRNSNKHNPAEYGRIDKPQFMWAAGWYLYCIYELFGK